MKKDEIKFLIHRIKMYGFNFLVHRRINLPMSIGLEISKACNRRCHYCPQSINPHKQEIVKPEIWKTFIDRLVEYKWHGATSIIKYNEPTIVKDSENYVRDLVLIGTRPVIFSNGDRPEVLRHYCEIGKNKGKLIKPMSIIVTEHPPYNDKWIEPLSQLKKDFSSIVKVNRLKWIHNQAGRVQGEHLEHCFQANAIGVNTDGQVSMCCLDYEGEYIMGDIKTQTFKEIWNNERYKEIRYKVVRGISATKMCESCFA